MKTKTCTTCGAEGLIWREIRGIHNRKQWRLFDPMGGMHTCNSLNSRTPAESSTMENQHRKINGYRELTQAEINLMNEIKELGPVIEKLSEKIRAHIDAQYQKTITDEASGVEVLMQNAKDERERLIAADPYKWLNWGRDGMQSNIMYLTRAIAQPTSF